MICICPHCSQVFEQAPPKESRITNHKKALRIKEICLDYYDMTEREILSHSRKKELVACRHMMIYLTRKYCMFSHETIGEMYNREHTSVIHACERLQNCLFTKGDLYSDLMKLQEIIEAEYRLKVANPPYAAI